jgi:DNA-binding LytR/AlgR family response regulator
LSKGEYLLLDVLFNKKQLFFLNKFLKQYGVMGLEKALRLYSDMNQEYLCKTKSSVSKVKIGDIYFLIIQKHNISVHTEHDILFKYGTLANELKVLSMYGFMKCNQSCLVSLDKIKTIRRNEVILINNIRLHMSRSCTAKILTAFTGNNSVVNI